MQGKQRLTLTVIGILAMVLIATVGTARAVQEVCTTPPISLISQFADDQIACNITNAFAYGPMQVTIRIFNNTGIELTHEQHTVEPMQMGVAAVRLGDFPSAVGWSCRFEVTPTLVGYSRGAIALLRGVQVPAGYPAVCTPY